MSRSGRPPTGRPFPSSAVPVVDAPRDELQRRMRKAEGRLAEDLALDGWTVVCDGPLSFVRSTDLPVCGYVKTHHRPLLVPEEHAKIGLLAGGQRSPLFAISDHY